MIDLTEYVSVLNDEGVRFHRTGGDAIFDKLKTQSVKLCGELDNRFPISDPITGKRFFESPENLCFAAGLILSAWLGWDFKSKSIEHYKVAHPEQEIHLARTIMPMIVEAYGQGIQKAILNKTSAAKGNGKPTKLDSRKDGEGSNAPTTT